MQGGFRSAPVPVRLQRERENFPRHQQHQQPQQLKHRPGSSHGLGGTQGGAVTVVSTQPVPDRRVETVPLAPTDSNSASWRADERMLAMESRLLRLEQERQEAQIMSARSPVGDSSSTAELVALKQGMRELGRHVSGLEEGVKERNWRIRTLEEELAAMRAHAQALASSTTSTANNNNNNNNKSNEDDERKEAQEMQQAKEAQEAQAEKEGRTVAEVVRIGTLCATLHERMDHLKASVAGKVVWTEKQAGETHQQVLGLLEREHATKDELSRARQRVADLEAQLHATSARQQKTLEDLHSALLRTDGRVAEKQERHLQEVTSRIAQDRSDTSQAVEALRSELAAQMAHIAESAELDARKLDARVERFRAATDAKDVDLGMQRSEMRQALTDRLDRVEQDLQSEEATRMKAVRRVHEDLLEQMEALRSGGVPVLMHVGAGAKKRAAGGRAAGGGASGAVGVVGDSEAAGGGGPASVEDLEEIVRAEVRARLRHEAKAREHVENTAKTLQASHNAVKQRLVALVGKLEASTEERAAGLGEAHAARMKRIEDKLAEEKHGRCLGHREALERVSACEAKVAKRAALHQIDFGRLRAEVQGAVAAQDDSRRGWEARCASLADAAASAQRKGAAALDHRLGQLDSEVKRALYAAQEVAGTRLDGALATCAEVAGTSEARAGALEARLELELAAMGDKVSGVEAAEASGACLEDILGEIEAREEGERTREKAAADEERLQAQLEDTMGDKMEVMEARFGEHRAEYEADVAAFQTMVQTATHEAGASIESLREELREVVGAAKEREAAVESSVQALETQLEEAVSRGVANGIAPAEDKIRTLEARLDADKAAVTAAADAQAKQVAALQQQLAKAALLPTSPTHDIGDEESFALT